MTIAPKRTRTGLQIAEEGEHRILVTTYSDGEESRERLIRRKRKVRSGKRAQFSGGLDKSRKKGF